MIELQEGYYISLKLKHQSLYLVQNMDEYYRLKKEAEKDHIDTAARWEIHNKWVRCVYLDDKGLTPLLKDTDLPDSPVVCVLYGFRDV